jgi:Rps23 Pro-64 3,4-dihydroxylase Tpa1-like proline 4-hydroxylase
LDPKYEMTYHRMKAPYWSHFHCDRLSDWHSDEIDFVGISFFMNEDWKYNDGGLFAWKQSWDSDRGEFVEPIQNRLIINPNDYPHAVTQITNPDVMRHSIQIFIAKEYVL